MARQTIQLPSSWWRRVATGGRWEPPTGGTDRPLIDAALSPTGATRYFTNIALRSDGDVIRLFFEDVRAGFAAGHDLSAAFEATGSVTLEANGQTFVFEVSAGGDLTEPYFVAIPAQGTYGVAAYRAFRDQLSTTAGAQAGVMILDDGVAVGAPSPVDTGLSIDGSLAGGLAVGVELGAVPTIPTGVRSTHTGTLPAPAAHLASDGVYLATWNDIALEIPASLADGNNAIFLRYLNVRDASGTTRIEARFATTATGSPLASSAFSADLSSTFEMNGRLILEYDGTSMEVPSDIIDNDQTNTYRWESRALAGGVQSFLTALESARAGATITFDDGQIPRYVDTSLSVDGGLDGALALAPSLGALPTIDVSLSVDGELDGDLTLPPSLGTPPPLSTGLSVDGGLDGALVLPPELGPLPPIDVGLSIDGDLGTSLALAPELGAAPRALIANEPTNLLAGQSFDFDIDFAERIVGTPRWVSNRGLINSDGEFVLPGDLTEPIEVTVELRDQDTIQEIALESAWFSRLTSRIQWQVASGRPALDDDFTDTNVDAFFTRFRMWADGEIQSAFHGAVSGGANQNLVAGWATEGWIELETINGDGETERIRVTNTGLDGISPYRFLPANPEEASSIGALVESILAGGASPSARLFLVLHDGRSVDTKTFTVSPPPLTTGLSVDGGLDGTPSIAVELGTAPPLNTAWSEDGGLDGALSLDVELGTPPPLSTSIALDGGLGGALRLEPALGAAPPVDTALSVDGGLDGALTLPPEVGDPPPLDIGLAFDLGADGGLSATRSLGSLRTFQPPLNFLPEATQEQALPDKISEILRYADEKYYQTQVREANAILKSTDLLFDIDTFLSMVSTGDLTSIVEASANLGPTHSYVFARLLRLKGTLKGLLFLLDFLGIGGATVYEGVLMKRYLDPDASGFRVNKAQTISSSNRNITVDGSGVAIADGAEIRIGTDEFTVDGEVAAGSNSVITVDAPSSPVSIADDANVYAYDKELTAFRTAFPNVDATTASSTDLDCGIWMVLPRDSLTNIAGVAATQGYTTEQDLILFANQLLRDFMWSCAELVLALENVFRETLVVIETFAVEVDLSMDEKLKATEELSKRATLDADAATRRQYNEEGLEYSGETPETTYSGRPPLTQETVEVKESFTIEVVRRK